MYIDKFERNQRYIEKILEKMCFFMFGTVWTLAGVLFILYGLCIYAIVSISCAASFWSMILDGYTAPLSLYDEYPSSLLPEEREKILEKIGDL